MSTLVVRPLTATDLPAVRSFACCDTYLESSGRQPMAPGLLQYLLTAVPIVGRRTRVFVAELDGSTAASVTARSQTRRYRWDVVQMAARQEFMDRRIDDTVHTWVALLEYAIRRAGESGVKRLFASAPEGCPAYDALRAAAFEPYTRYWVLSGRVRSGPVPYVAGFKRQDASDVWSVHQLYHRATPMVVQHAEALTSASWELPEVSWLRRLTLGGPEIDAYVVDDEGNVVAYCAVRREQDGVAVHLLIDPDHRQHAVDIVMLAARESDVRPGTVIRTVIPAYAGELVRQFTEEGFDVDYERVALVRHTTVSARVVARAVTPLTEAPERVPKGVPTYCHPLDDQPSPHVSTPRRRRMESAVS